MKNNKTEVLYERLKEIGVPHNYISKFIDKGIVREVPRNEVLVNFGEECNHIIIVLKGGFVSQQKSENETPRTVNFFLDSHEPFMTSFHSFFGGEPSRVQLMAIKKSTVLMLEKIGLERIDHNYLSFKNYYLRVLIHILLVENEFKSYLITKTPQELYETILKQYPELIRDVPNKYISEFMGITRVWLSNLKRRGLNK